MIITTIYRIFFTWTEYEAQAKFEKENPDYQKIAEDTNGTTYEYRKDYAVDMAERKEDATDGR